MASLPVDPLTVTASELQNGLTAGKFNTSQLIELYLDQISKHNSHLKTVLETSPEGFAEIFIVKYDFFYYYWKILLYQKYNKNIICNRHTSYRMIGKFPYQSHRV